MSQLRMSELPDREAAAAADIAATEVSGRVGLPLIVGFLLAILAVPVAQVCLHGPAILDAGRALPSAAEHLQRSRAEGAWLSVALLRADQQLVADWHRTEQRLQRELPLAESVGGPVRRSLLSLGSSQGSVAVGPDGRLFLRAELDELIAPGFLSSRWQSRQQGGRAGRALFAHSDPRPAIRDLAAQLRARGIRLVLLPVPSKPMIDPRSWSPKAADAGADWRNRSWDAWLAELRADGVGVLDARRVLLNRKAISRRPLFLATDTHWTPEAMEAVARALAAELAGQFGPPPSGEELAFYAEPTLVTNRGDLAVMAELDERETTLIQTVRQLRDRRPWQPDPAADVLLLGDSYSNIFSLEGMGWGSSAGLAEWLSMSLRRPVDAIVRNDAGAVSSRRELVAQLAAGQDRLAGKRVVVWQFAVRELAFGDWEPLTLPTVAKLLKPTTPHDERLLITATVRQVAALPTGPSPYRDALLAVELSDARAADGRAAPRELVVYVWGLTNAKRTLAADWRIGQVVELQLTPWPLVEAKFGRYRRLELDDPDGRLLELPTFWAEIRLNAL